MRKNITTLTFLVLAIGAWAQSSNPNSREKITVDSVQYAGDRAWVQHQFHLTGTSKTATMFCKFQYPDCGPLVVGDTFEVQAMQDGDPEGYAGKGIAGSVRVYGTGTRTHDDVSFVFAVFDK